MHFFEVLQFCMKFKLIDNIEYGGSGGGDHWIVQRLVISDDKRFSANIIGVSYFC